MSWKRDNNNDQECNCCIRIEESFVLIVCGELDPNQLRENLKTFIEMRDNKVMANVKDE
ncbi:hypothetical protein Tph_c05020 [Thermacetogenium phaeum DSM 12270]|uniref:Uncharacterized protein n=1 Tax=Thermacetogenium phaeum (strain ATCC BAA-254 / DSM 26808 / PB) TaxID=1089553 RepID=K4LFH1_THEPS|nr:hypothetical protein [Thermacetogenium phaeum]AFV10740.1 hypothetical protein Tph_c05020 [Thermacetogenium phaeum DSM 12270]